MDFLSPWPCVSCVGFIPVREEAEDAHPGPGVPKTWRAMGASHQRYLASGDGCGEKNRNHGKIIRKPWENA